MPQHWSSNNNFVVCGHVPPQTEPFEACGLPNEKVELSQLVSCDLQGFDNRRDRNHKLSGKAPPRGVWKCDC